MVASTSGVAGRSPGRSKTAEAEGWKRQFGDRVRELRKQAGVSQERLADLAGVHRTYLGAVERGEQNVSLTNIHEVAKALGVPRRPALREPGAERLRRLRVVPRSFRT